MRPELKVIAGHGTHPQKTTDILSIDIEIDVGNEITEIVIDALVAEFADRYRLGVSLNRFSLKELSVMGGRPQDWGLASVERAPDGELTFPTTDGMTEEEWLEIEARTRREDVLTIQLVRLLREQAENTFVRQHGKVLDIVAAAGGEAVKSVSGHSFIKEKMREVDGIYGGEMSAHHYFRDFSYADSGMIPWLLVAELMSVTGKSLSELVGERMAMYPASGEINRQVEDARATLQTLHDRYAADALDVDDTDGYSFEFADWRFNIRMSNTEPVVRLNVESRGDESLMQEKTAEVLAILEA